MRYLYSVAAIGFICLLVAELALRIVGFSLVNFYQYSECCGSALRPSFEGAFSKEGSTHIKINSDGLRDREYTVSKPESVYRIAVLGDSYTEALQVTEDEAFWGILEAQLNSPERQVEVMNFGVSGYGTAQELHMLRHKVLKYQPDLVVLAFLTGNDIRNNAEVLEKSPLRPYYLLEEGNLVLDNSYLQEPGFKVERQGADWLFHFLLDNLRIVQLANQVRLAMKQAAQAKVQAQAQSQGAQIGEAGLDSQVYLPFEQLNEDWQQAWQVTFSLLKAVQAESNNHGADFLLVGLSNGIQVNPDEVKRAAFKASLGVETLHHPDDMLAAFSRDNQVAFLPLVEPLKTWAKANKTCVHGFENAIPCGGHWNQHGHQVAGKLLAAHIESQYLQRQP